MPGNHCRPGSEDSVNNSMWVLRALVTKCHYPISTQLSSEKKLVIQRMMVKWLCLMRWLLLKRIVESSNEGTHWSGSGKGIVVVAEKKQEFVLSKSRMLSSHLPNVYFSNRVNWSIHKNHHIWKPTDSHCCSINGYISTFSPTTHQRFTSISTGASQASSAPMAWRAGCSSGGHWPHRNGENGQVLFWELII